MQWHRRAEVGKEAFLSLRTETAIHFRLVLPVIITGMLLSNRIVCLSLLLVWLFIDT